MKAGTERRETKFDRTFEMLPCFNTHAKPWHFPSKDGLCVSSAHVPSGYVRDFKRQAAELRKTGREAARGFKRKNRRGFPTEASHLVSVALLPLFPFSTLKTASFWTWTGQVQATASHTRLAFQGHIYLWIQSLNPTFRPLILGSI